MEWYIIIFGAGFSGGLAGSNGNTKYAHQAGMSGLAIGSAVGTGLGAAYGLISGYDFSPPEIEHPSYPWNEPLNASASNSGYGLSDGSKENLPLIQEEMYLVYEHTFLFPANDFSSSFTASFQGGTHVRMEMTNMNYLGARVDLTNKSYHQFKPNARGIKRKVYPGGNFGLAFLPGQTISKDFYRGIDAPRMWSFELNSISDVLNLRIRMFSNWKP